jgi:hypothetical protein
MDGLERNVSGRFSAWVGRHPGVRKPYMSGTLSRPFLHGGASRFLSCFGAFFCSSAPGDRQEVGGESPPR